MEPMTQYDDDDNDSTRSHERRDNASDINMWYHGYRRVLTQLEADPSLFRTLKFNNINNWTQAMNKNDYIRNRLWIRDDYEKMERDFNTLLAEYIKLTYKRLWD
jgi:hypothetical protein